MHCRIILFAFLYIADGEAVFLCKYGNSGYRFCLLFDLFEKIRIPLHRIRLFYNRLQESIFRFQITGI